MKTYIVTVPVETTELYRVKARSAEQAIRIVAEGDGDSCGLSDDNYTADTDTNNWIVEESE